VKTAIYIQDGDVQLVITPENQWEKNALNSFGDKVDATVMRGSFYACAGGWIRQTSCYGDSINDRPGTDEDRSLILRAKKDQR
jgi:hypothetical protein